MYVYIYIHNILKKYLDLSNLGIFIFLWLSLSRPCSCWSLALPCCFGCFGFGTGNSRRPEKSEPTPPDVVKCDRRVGLGFPGLEHLKFKCAYLFQRARFHSWDLSEIYESLCWIGKFGRRLKSAVPFCLSSHSQPKSYHAFSLLASNMAQYGMFPFRSQSIYTLW